MVTATQQLGWRGCWSAVPPMMGSVDTHQGVQTERLAASRGIASPLDLVDLEENNAVPSGNHTI